MDDDDDSDRPSTFGEGRDAYDIIDLLGKGGMAEVWRGRDRRLGRHVAIKFIAAKHRGRDDIARRFRHEIDTLLGLEHPHIVTVYDHGEARDGRLYLVMELLRGATLEKILSELAAKEQVIEWRQLISIAQQVCNALEATHALGLVHRDIKPSNISCRPMASGAVFVKLLDFGIAKVCEDLQQEKSEDLTALGTFIGTHHYAAPEMIHPHEFGMPDGRADIFSLGVVLYRCATGVLPFQGLRGNAVLWKTWSETPPSPCERAPDHRIPALLDALIMRAMAIRPEHRFDSVSALSAALHRVTRSLDNPERSKDGTKAPEPRLQRPKSTPPAATRPPTKRSPVTASAPPALPQPPEHPPSPPQSALHSASDAPPAVPRSALPSPPGESNLSAVMPPTKLLPAEHGPPGAVPNPASTAPLDATTAEHQIPPNEPLSSVTTSIHSPRTGNPSTGQPGRLLTTSPLELEQTHEPDNGDPESTSGAARKTNLWVAAGLVGIIGISLYFVPAESPPRSSEISAISAISAIMGAPDKAEDNHPTNLTGRSGPQSTGPTDASTTGDSTTDASTTDASTTDDGTASDSTLAPPPTPFLVPHAVKKSYRDALFKLLKTRQKRVRKCQMTLGPMVPLDNKMEITVQATNGGKHLKVRVLSKSVSKRVKSCVEKELRRLITPNHGRGARSITYTYEV